jgi:hypothetical protein
VDVVNVDATAKAKTGREKIFDEYRQGSGDGEGRTGQWCRRNDPLVDEVRCAFSISRARVNSTH